MNESTVANLTAEHAEVYEKIALVLSSEDIDTIGTDILMNGAELTEVILCLEGGTSWSNEIEQLLEPEVSSRYERLDKNEWILLRVPIAFCFDIMKVVNDSKITARLSASPKTGHVRAFFLFETDEVAMVDVLINPSHAHGIRLN
jgi:hypothetical protein